MVAQISKYRKKKEDRLHGLLPTVIFLAILVGGLGFLLFYNVKIGQKKAELEKKAQDLQQRIGELSQRKAELESGLAEVNTTEFQEKILREKGLYKKPGEEVVTILPQEEEKTIQEEQEEKVWWNPWSWFKSK